MKRLLVVTVLAMTLGGAAGCHIGECWTYAWNSRFHPERNRPCVQQPCMVTDSCCDQCDGATIVTTPGCGCAGGGTPVVTGPMVAH
jgi:hypothetical protein